MEKASLRIAGRLIFWLATNILLHQNCVAGSAENTDVLKSNFSSNAPLPTWAIPLAPIPETNRTDPVVVRLNEYQVQLGTETAMLMNRAIQVNERNVLSKIGQYSIVYYPVFQKLKLHKIALIRAGHVIDKMDSVNIRQLQRETSMESGMYGGATTVEMLLDDVRVGDTLCIVYSVIGENPVFDKKWHSEFTWDSNEPVELRRITLTYPKNRKIYWKQIGDFSQEIITERVEDSNGQNRIQFEEHGINAIEFEPSMPSEYIPIRLLEFSEYADWQGVAKWADGLFPKAKDSPSLNELAKEFSREVTPEKKAAAALHWVQNEIRYFSVSIGENSHRPQSPEVVIKKRYGDCKDKSYLLVSILGKLGIKAIPVLISSHTPKIPAKVIPSPEWFDHVIVRIELNNQHYFVDPTITGQVSPLESIPVAMPEASGLYVDSLTTNVMTLPARKDVGPNYEHNEHIKVGQFDGNAVLVMHDIYSGFYSDWARNHFANLTANELRKEILSYYEKQYPDVTMEETPELKDDKENNQFHVQAHLLLPTPVKHENQLYSVTFDSQILKGAMKIPDKLVRNFPFSIVGGKHMSRYRLVIDWPDTVRMNYPPIAKRIDNPFFRVQEDMQISGNQSMYSMDFEIKDDLVPAKEMSTLHSQTKLLDKFVNSSLSVPEKMVVSPEALKMSLRTFDASKVAGHLFQQQKTMITQLADNKEINEEICDFLANTITYSDVFYVDPIIQNSISSRQNADNTNNDFERKCFTYLYYAKGQYEDSVKASGTTQAIPDNHVFTKDLAWAHFYTQDNDAALLLMDKYVSATTANNTWFYLLDLASQIALYQREGKPIPNETVKLVNEVNGGIWPRPIFTMQLGSLRPDDLLKLTNNMPSDTRDLSQVEAWFYIGQKYLAERNFIEAKKAFKKVVSRGMRNSDLYMQAKHELGLLTKDEPENSAGLTAFQRKDYKSANDIWEQKAIKGDIVSQRYLAFDYLYGFGLTKDYALALHWFQLSAEKGDDISQYYLGSMYEYGQGVEKDLNKALFWYQKSSEQDDDRALYALGRFYFSGLGVGKDLAESLRLFNLSADQGYVDAQDELGYLYSEGIGVTKNYPVVITWSLFSSMHGSVGAMNRLGYLFQMGYGVEKDVNKAMDMYRAAAEKGNEVAEFNLGNNYRWGTGVKPNLSEAMRWFRLSADKGYAKAQYNIGLMYELGQSVSRDLSESEKWYRIAANNGNRDAQYRLGQFYEFGINVHKDISEAVIWYKKAAGQDHADASNDLGALYEKGGDIGKDQQEALKWYLKAASLGNTIAQNNLGTIYLNDDTLPEHLTEAEKWFRQAAEQGNLNAQNNLAVLLSQSQAVPQNDIEAYKWWRVVKKKAKPGSSNFNSASRGLELLNEKLNVDDIAIANKASEVWLSSKTK